jgi:hypothetical protein
MTQIGLDSHPFGVPASDDHCADVSGPRPGYVDNTMVSRKFIGETTAKVVRLSNIYRIPKAISPLMAEDVNAADGVERDVPDPVVVEFVPRTARPDPNETRVRVD